MPEIIFIEGVSGVGKSTMCAYIKKRLENYYYRVRAYPEFDFTNPIDFYCTAYLRPDEYGYILKEYPDQKDAVLRYTHPAGDARLVRYYDEDTPLFDGELLSYLSEREFCYDPKNPVPLEAYSLAYRNVWTRFEETLPDQYDFLIFDGSLIHHPVNDMIRNYDVSQEQAKHHVKMLLDILKNRRTYLFYMETDDLPAYLERAHKERGQKKPTEEEIAFWKKRYEYDLAVLSELDTEKHVLKVSDCNWDKAEEKILSETAQITEYDLKFVFDRVKSLAPVRWSQSQAEDDGFKGNFPIIAGNVNGRIFWLYEYGGDFVFSFEDDRYKNMHNHTHPQNTDEAIELILDYVNEHQKI